MWSQEHGMSGSFMFFFFVAHETVPFHSCKDCALNLDRFVLRLGLHFTDVFHDDCLD